VGMAQPVLRGILERRMSPKSLEGLIGIARLSGEAASEGPTAYFGLTAMISLNLAIFNLPPIIPILGAIRVTGYPFPFTSVSILLTAGIRARQTL
jgi:membrane-associated protease RseP (regulator of RpoE activity)